MSKVIGRVRDIWCVLTHRCKPRIQDDQFMQYLKEEEQAAIQSAERIRQRRRNIYEEHLRGQRAGEHP